MKHKLAAIFLTLMVAGSIIATATETAHARDTTWGCPGCKTTGH